MSIYMNLGRKDVSDIFALSSVADINAGSKRGGEQVYDKEGEIGLLTLYTTVQVRVPKNTRISYIKVNVHAISSPKVDFDEQTNTVSIKYSWTQITLSSYRIFAKGVHEIALHAAQNSLRVLLLFCDCAHCDEKVDDLFILNMDFVPACSFGGVSLFTGKDNTDLEILTLFFMFTPIEAHVPSNMRVSYVKVTVYAINSPSVNFNEHTNINDTPICRNDDDDKDDDSVPVATNNKGTKNFTNVARRFHAASYKDIKRSKEQLKTELANVVSTIGVTGMQLEFLLDIIVDFQSKYLVPRMTALLLMSSLANLFAGMLAAEDACSQAALYTASHRTQPGKLQLMFQLFIADPEHAGSSSPDGVPVDVVLRAVQASSVGMMVELDVVVRLDPSSSTVYMHEADHSSFPVGVLAL
ncbi:hypothetical protein MSG28_009289 [Choristoneura fumiferana]|uniref:Uncharacterized protein n=1 Tax=Choristoneura fumiferana TaxID=7141 RepID=A0ACC0KY60_CHOFU|nr:hypothetical protein MSG28_009289 [Choristoneura fumiferana]